MNMNTFISIEGNIGSGKSSILRIIRKHFPELRILEEPLEEWEKVGDANVNLLGLYYENPKRWGFTFQIYAFMSRLKKWVSYNSQKEGNCFCISQRSLLSDRYVFASLMHDMEILDNMEYMMYLDCYANLISMNQITPIKGIIYVQCPSNICAERIKKRDRKGEVVQEEYLTKLHCKHEQWLSEQYKKNLKTRSNEEKKVLIIDNSQELNQSKVVRQVSEWLKSF